MIISEHDAAWAADEFIDYFKNFTSIEHYLRYAKGQALAARTTALPGCSNKDTFFNEDISPEEMEFEVIPVGDRFSNSFSQEIYLEYLTATSSHVIEHNIPGRELRWIVKEKRTQKIMGFIRFGSPVINSKPRNIWLGKAPDLSVFNRHAAMGFAIVPSQPFGYNYLGGKLLALLCISHFARETLNEVFEKEIGLFETTSLYGSTTSASQYDGLKPFIRYKGLTDSKFLPLLHKEAFHRLHDRFTKLNNNTPLTSNAASSKKMKRQTKMISIIRKNLKNEEKLKEFNAVIKMAFDLTQRKRFYISDYGYGNIREVILGKEDKLIPGQNWDKFHLENIISWWKRKATMRYETLKKDGRFRTEVELWTEDDDIQIIR